MRYLVATVAAALLCGPAFADNFNFSSGRVVTHRGSNVAVTTGLLNLDKSNRMTCKSAAGCSLVIQTQVNFEGVNYLTYNSTLCTLVDGVPADPGCQPMTSGSSGTVTSFQGRPSLPMGRHVVQTQINAANPATISQFQIVYTLYEHE